MDARLKLASGCIVVGPSQCGKTTWCKKLLKQANNIFDTEVKNIYWYYGMWSISLLEFKKEVNYIVREGMPASQGEIEPNSIVVIDDLLDGDFSEIFTKWTHHIPCHVIKITQNLYHGPKNRTTNLNAQYIVLFKYPGDKMSVRTLATQMKKDWLMQAYEEATKKPYNYLFIDLHQQTPEEIRVRTNILPGEGMMTVFKAKKH
jgi:hypothetical protein